MSDAGPNPAGVETGSERAERWLVRALMLALLLGALAQLVLWMADIRVSEFW